MAIILSLETSTKVSSVALHSEGQLVGAQELHIDKSHSGLLTVMIDDLLKCCDISISQLAAVAVSNGPGSYTGLRIGLSSAKGLCFGLDIPLITLNTLKILSQAVIPFISDKSWLCPMLDARRMEVYTIMHTKTEEEILPMQAKIIEVGSFASELNTSTIYFFGSGAAKCKPLMANYSNAKFIDGVKPLASNMGLLAYNSYLQQNISDLAYTEPIYLKEFGGRPLSK